MATRFFSHIGLLAGTEHAAAPLSGEALGKMTVLEDAWLQVDGDRIAGFGPMATLPAAARVHAEDLGGAAVLPGWCDSHTHLVFAGSREAEFVQKIRGRSYAEINAAGGGILNSARRVHEASEEALFAESWARLQEVLRLGTTALEIKSGYGLDPESEYKMLRVIRRLKERSGMPIRASFLGAHAYPAAFRDDHEGYLAQLTGEMIPRIAAEKLADYVDVFCEEGFFSAEETDRICRAARASGLKPRLHVNQLHSIGGIGVGIRHHAVSLDHLETLTDADVEMLGGYAGLSTLLPSAAFFLRMAPPPARRLIDAGARIALASDFNPGSSPSGNMNLVVALACIQLRMTPEEAMNAATMNGAHALEWQDEVGSLSPGKRANLIVTRPLPSLAYLPYAFGTNLIDRVMLNGEFVADRPILDPKPSPAC